MQPLKRSNRYKPPKLCNQCKACENLGAVTEGNVQGALVGTGEAARSIGVARNTLVRWADAGLVTPADETLGGHLRWDLEQLRAQVQRIKDERRAAREERRQPLEDRQDSM